MDDSAFVQGLSRAMSQAEDLTPCGQSSRRAEALKTISRNRPDLVVVGGSPRGQIGWRLIQEIRSSNRGVKVLAVGMDANAGEAARLLRAGADGYVVRFEDPEEVCQAMRDVLDGLIYVSEQVMSGNGPSGRASGKNRSKIGP